MPANQQRAVTYSLQGGIAQYVLGTVDGTIADFVLNGATGISLSVDATALAGPTTVTFYIKTTPFDSAKLLGVFIVGAGTAETIITQPSFGPLVAYAVQVTANNAGGGDFIVSARAQ